MTSDEAIIIEMGARYNRRNATPVVIIDVLPMSELEIDISTFEKTHLPYDDTPIYIAYCSINQEIRPYFKNGRMVSYVNMNKGLWNTDIIEIAKPKERQ